jgi:outer membrane protein assembly factor BamD
MLGFIDYLKLDYDEAIYKFNKIIRLYPSHKNIDYAYYMIAMCYYEQIKGENFDGFNNKEALKNFQKILNKFPKSDYAKDSSQKIIFINEIIAAKHMNIAMFYYEKSKYLAALNRYKIVINDHSKSKFTPEALYRLVEIYSILGMEEEAKNAASVIVYNYPKSKWYKNAFNLIKRKEIKDNKISLKKKLFNLIKKNEVNK